jgi:hypothetical protein
MASYEGREHFLRISEEEGLEVFHPEGCEQREIMAKVLIYSCDIGEHINEWGMDLHLSELEPGIYLAQYWYVPMKWAGSHPIEADDGINLTRLTKDTTCTW